MWQLSVKLFTEIESIEYSPSPCRLSFLLLLLRLLRVLIDSPLPREKPTHQHILDIRINQSKVVLHCNQQNKKQVVNSSARF